MEVLTDAKSKEMIWRNGDEQYYPGGVTDRCTFRITRHEGY
jgi:general stress protein 26